MQLKKNIVITGGSSGLGVELARHYAKQGHHLGLIARNEGKLQSAAEELQGLSPASTVGYYSADLSDEGQAIAAVESLAATLGGIDILINSAGVLYEGRFENIPQEAFVHVMNVNLFGVINTTRAALAHLKHSRGQLVNIASMASLTGVFGYTAYAASKHALAVFLNHYAVS